MVRKRNKGIRYPKGWPSGKAKKKYPNGWPGNLRAVLYLNNRNRIEQVAGASSEWGDSLSWVDSAAWTDGA